MSYFTAVLARHGRGWRVLDLDVDDAEDMDDLAELVRGALPGDGPGLAIIEREDAWFALVRVDEDGEPRPFVSDLRESLRRRYATLLELAADVDIPEELDGLADVESLTCNGFGTEVDEDDPPAARLRPMMTRHPTSTPRSRTTRRPRPERRTPDLSDLDDEDDVRRPARTWAGDPGLLDDLGLSAQRAGAADGGGGRRPGGGVGRDRRGCGFDEQLDSLR